MPKNIKELDRLCKEWNISLFDVYEYAHLNISHCSQCGRMSPLQRYGNGCCWHCKTFLLNLEVVMTTKKNQRLKND